MSAEMNGLWTMTHGEMPILATAIHNGHELRPSVATAMGLSPVQRRMEEDPYTDALASVVANTIVPLRSRFEVDLNRSPEEAVYESATDAWGLDLWLEQPSAALVEGSRELHGLFYDVLEQKLRDLESRFSWFMVLDIHSYNHRRESPWAEPADPATNPEINVGTGSLPRAAWSDLVDGFIADLQTQIVRGRPLDVRENIKFRGRYLAEFVHTRFPNTGCALALEFKKTFMDEWTGIVDEEHLGALRAALAATIPGLLEHLAVR